MRFRLLALHQPQRILRHLLRFFQIRYKEYALQQSSSLGRRSGGFSLLEIMVALALFATVVLGFLSLFPALNQQVVGIEQSTHASCIARSILETLKGTEPQGVLAIGPNWENNANATTVLSLKVPSTHFIAYDSKDRPVRLVTAEEYKDLFHEAGVTSLVHIAVIKKREGANTTLVEVTVATPARRPDAQRHHFSFSLLISTLQQDEEK